MQSMHVEHYNGTAPGAPAYVDVKIRRPLCQRLNIRNLDTVNALQVSFDNGTNFYTIPANTVPLDFPCAIQHFIVRGKTDPVDWTAVSNEG